MVVDGGGRLKKEKRIFCGTWKFWPILLCPSQWVTLRLTDRIKVLVPLFKRITLLTLWFLFQWLLSFLYFYVVRRCPFQHTGLASNSQSTKTSPICERIFYCTHNHKRISCIIFELHTNIQSRWQNCSLLSFYFFDWAPFGPMHKSHRKFIDFALTLDYAKFRMNWWSNASSVNEEKA